MYQPIWIILDKNHRIFIGAYATEAAAREALTVFTAYKTQPPRTYALIQQAADDTGVYKYVDRTAETFTC